MAKCRKKERDKRETLSHSVPGLKKESSMVLDTRFIVHIIIIYRLNISFTAARIWDSREKEKIHTELV